MSGQHGQATPARLKTSTGNAGGGVKQGPLKATIPMSSVTKQGSDLRKSTSPTTTWRTKTDCLGQRSPGSTASKAMDPSGKSRLCNKVNTIRRTASLDTIYLKGLFPRDGFLLQRDRATQTDISSSLDSLQTSSKIVEDNLGKLTMRQRRRSTSRESNPRHLSPSDQTTTTSSQTTSSFSPTNKANKSSRSSEEGLNQEIERIIKSESDPQCSDRLREPTPEGRKAPIADILRVAGMPCHEDSHLIHLDQDRQETSPRINKFLSREPPDGCERVSLKTVTLVKPIPIERVPQPRSLFQLKPSSHSAFECLTKSDDNSPKVPDINN